MMTDELTYDSASEALVEAIPELRPQYEKELEWWKGEKPGQYIIYEDILKPFVFSLLREKGDEELLARVFAFLDSLVATGDFDLKNLVGIALLEEIAFYDDLWDASRKFMGAATSTWASTIRASASSPEDGLVYMIARQADSVMEKVDAELHGLLAAQQELAIDLHEALVDAGWEPPPAVRHLQWAPLGRARIEAALVGLPDELLDGKPAQGHWSIRQHLAHVELTDARYSIATQHAVRRRGDEPLLPGEDAYPPRQGEPVGNPGEPLAAIIPRMRQVRLDALEPLLGISAGALLLPTEWHTAEHTVGFRLHRFAQHDLEAATDIQAIAHALGHRLTRAMRIAAALVEERGEVEHALFGVPGTIAHSGRPWELVRAFGVLESEAIGAVHEASR